MAAGSEGSGDSGVSADESKGGLHLVLLVILGEAIYRMRCESSEADRERIRDWGYNQFRSRVDGDESKIEKA